MPSAQPYNEYDAIAVMYTATNDSKAYNAYYERPVSLALAGDVAGLRVLRRPEPGIQRGHHLGMLGADRGRPGDRTPALRDMTARY
jgi:hypothetical protein